MADSKSTIMEAITLAQIEAINENNRNILEQSDELDGNTKGTQSNSKAIEKNVDSLNTTSNKLAATATNLSLTTAGLKTNSSKLMDNSSVMNQLIGSNRRLNAVIFSNLAATKLNIQALKYLGVHIGKAVNPTKSADAFKKAMEGLEDTAVNKISSTAANMAGGSGGVGKGRMAGLQKKADDLLNQLNGLNGLGPNQAGPVTKMLQKYAAPGPAGVKGVGGAPQPVTAAKLPSVKQSKAMGGMFSSLGKMGPKMLALAIGLKIAQGVFAPFGMFMETFGAFGEILGTAFLPVLIPINNVLIKAIPHLVEFVKFTGFVGDILKYGWEQLQKIQVPLISFNTGLGSIGSTLGQLDIGSVIRTLINPADWDLSVVQTAFNDLGAKILGFFTGIFEYLKNGVSNFIYEKFGVRL